MQNPFTADLHAAFEAQGRHYNIVRFFKDSGRRRIIRTRVTLEEAQAYCSDPETSSSACTSTEGRRRTARVGPWFCGFEER